MDDLQLIKHFIDKSPEFWNDQNLVEIDNKHKNVLKKFSDNFNYQKFLKEIRAWEMQDDGPIPFQLTFHHFKYYSLKRNLTNFLKFIISKFKKYDLSISFFDDLEILRKIDALKLLKENPVHLSPFVDNFYFISTNVSTNYRWNKYIYYANTILKKKLFKNDEIWVDIGSYYGGLQGIVAKYFKGYKIILVDFHHQLCRSYLYLNKIFPEAEHIIGNDIDSFDSIISKKSECFVYLSINNLNKIQNIKPYLLTNMFSFGEMTKSTFNQYFQSTFLKNSKFLYLVNRFVSSPFFENTYNNEINIYDYDIVNFKKKYFVVFPINHYQTPYRNLFGRNGPRPVSSSYFELIYEKIK